MIGGQLAGVSTICGWMVGLVGVVAFPAGGELLAAPPETLERYVFQQVEMGVPFRITLYAGSKRLANDAADRAFARISQLNAVCSDYDMQSELMQLCRKAEPGKPLPISDDLRSVLAQAQCIACRTEGAFDITVGPYVRLWRRARRRKELPSAKRLAESAERVGYEHLKLDAGQATLEKPGMLLDLGGIAKGFACQEARRILQQAGITRALIDGGGDLVAGDPPPNQPAWTIGISPGRQPEERPTEFLKLSRTAVATSGDAYQYVEIDGIRYSHIVDPHTGLGVTRRSRVTVVAPDGATADALASACSVLAPPDALRLIETLPRCEIAIFVIEHDRERLYRSPGFTRWLQSE